MLPLFTPIDRIEGYLHSSGKFASITRIENNGANIYEGDIIQAVSHRNKNLGNQNVRCEYHFDKRGRLRAVVTKAIIGGVEKELKTNLKLHASQKVFDKLFPVRGA